MGKIIVAAEKCSGCRICEAVCSARQMKYQGFNRKRCCIRVTFAGELEDNIRPVLCKQCKKPLCAQNCPTASLSYQDGKVELNKETCIGCGLCAQDCPFGAIILHPHAQEPYKCDLCCDVTGGPLCVQFCVTGALRLVDETAIGLVRGAKA